MAILYDFYPSPNPEGTEDGAPKLHARVVNKQTISPTMLINRICERSTLTKGDVLAMFSELNQEVTQALLEGHTVNIPGLGYFSLLLQTTEKVNPKSTRAQNIKVKRIEFRADSQLRNTVINEATFERSSIKRHSAILSNEEVKDAVQTYLQEHPYVTCKIVSELCNLTKGTAQKHIRLLVSEGFLVNTNTPRNPIYMLKKE